ncbi:unnamed protein product [Paramecium sonneborni]|uniref:Uncharacterized protein n=1 Tax=Paramecium sonneborni TaxID=65129 RepID=A0A8S1P707_9CILI|nr:unnamed protein product [Paramecium sonneborni]
MIQIQTEKMKKNQIYWKNVNKCIMNQLFKTNYGISILLLNTYFASKNHKIYKLSSLQNQKKQMKIFHHELYCFIKMEKNS